jgi:hypothetical protein
MSGNALLKKTLVAPLLGIATVNVTLSSLRMTTPIFLLLYAFERERHFEMHPPAVSVHHNQHYSIAFENEMCVP